MKQRRRVDGRRWSPQSRCSLARTTTGPGFQIIPLRRSYRPDDEARSLNDFDRATSTASAGSSPVASSARSRLTMSACRGATYTRLPRHHGHGRVEVFFLAPAVRPDGHAVPTRNDELVMCILFIHASTTDWVASHGTGSPSLYGCRISRQCMCNACLRRGHAVQRSRAATATALGAARGRVWHRKSSP